MRRPLRPLDASYGERMRVLIIRPEREATALATALAERGHTPVIAPLFRLEFLHPPAEFSAALAACQAVLLTSANGARALAEASEQRGRPILAVGDTTASTAEGLGFSAVTSASGDGAALADLVRQRLDPKDGPLLHVSGRDVAADLAAALEPAGFEVKRFVLYDAREETALPEFGTRGAGSARARRRHLLLAARGVGVRHAWSRMRAWRPTCTSVTAIAISPAAAGTGGRRCRSRRSVAAERPSRQAVLDEIDRLAEAPVQGQATMSDASEPLSPPPRSAAAAHAGHRAARPGRGRRLRGRRAGRGDRAGRCADLAALLAATGARPVARPRRGDPARRPASTCRRCAPTPPRRHRRRRYRTPRAHGAAGRSREAPARGLGDGGRAAGGGPRRSRSRHRRLEEPRRSAGAAARRQRRGAGARSGPEQRRGRKGDRRPDARDRGTARHAGRARSGRRHSARPGQGPERRRRRQKHRRAEGAGGGARARR